MGAQAETWERSRYLTCNRNLHFHCIMAPMKTMKAMSAKAMTKGAIAEALATEFEMKKTACSKLIDSLAVIATKEVKCSGNRVRDEEDSMLKVHRQFGCHCHQGSEERWQVRYPRCVHDQDSGKACEEGG